MKKSIILLGVLSLSWLSAPAWSFNTKLDEPYSKTVYNKVKADTFGNKKKVASSYRFHQNLSYELNDGLPYAVHAGSTNTIDIHLFKKDFSVFKLIARASGNMANAKGGQFRKELYMLNKKYLSENHYLQTQNQDLKRSWKTTDSAGKEKYMKHAKKSTVVPIPVVFTTLGLEIGYKGSVGVQGKMDLRVGLKEINEGYAYLFRDMEFGVTYGPAAYLDSFANLKISNIKWIRDTISFNNKLRLLGVKQMLEGKAKAQVFPRIGQVSLKLPGSVNTLSGKSSLSFKYPKVKTCSKTIKIFGKKKKIKWACGIEWKRKEVKIAEWKGYTRSWNLLNWTRNF